jgi:hypothetical protein
MTNLLRTVAIGIAVITASLTSSDLVSQSFAAQDGKSAQCFAKSVMDN